MFSDIIRIFNDMTKQKKKWGKQKSMFIAIGEFLELIWGVVLEDCYAIHDPPFHPNFLDPLMKQNSYNIPILA